MFHAEWLLCGFEGFIKTFFLHPKKNFYLLKSLLNAPNFPFHPKNKEKAKNT